MNEHTKSFDTLFETSEMNISSVSSNGHNQDYYDKKLIDNYNCTKYLIPDFKIPFTIFNNDQFLKYGLTHQNAMDGAFKMNEELYFIALIKLKFKLKQTVTLNGVKSIFKMFLQELDLFPPTFEHNTDKLFQQRPIFQPLNNQRHNGINHRFKLKNLLKEDTLLTYLAKYQIVVGESQILTTNLDFDDLEFQLLVESTPMLLELEEMIGGLDVSEFLGELSIKETESSKADEYSKALAEQEKVIEQSRLENAHLKKQLEMAHKIHILAKEKARLRKQLDETWDKIKKMQ